MHECDFSDVTLKNMLSNDLVPDKVITDNDNYMVVTTANSILFLLLISSTLIQLFAFNKEGKTHTWYESMYPIITNVF